MSSSFEDLFKQEALEQGLLDPGAVIKADTRVAIRVSDEPVRIHCSKCGRLQSAAGQTCETCRSPLPVILVEG